MLGLETTPSLFITGVKSNLVLTLQHWKRDLKQGILILPQQGDALCMVHCDIATHGSLSEAKHNVLLSSLMNMQLIQHQMIAINMQNMPCVHDYASRMHHK